MIKQQTGSNWIVTQFVEEHILVLSILSKVDLLRSHGNVTGSKRVMSPQLS